MPNSPDGRVATDGSCFGCNAPDGTPAPPGTGWIVWMRINGRWMCQPVPPPPAPNPYNRTTPAVSSTGPNPAAAPPTTIANPGTGIAPPNAGAPITTQGAPASAANPAIDTGRSVSGHVPGTSVTINNPA